MLFNPLQTFKRSEEMQLYYEVQGLQPGSPYKVRLAVRKQGGSGGLFRKIFGGGGAAISLKFDAQAAAIDRVGPPGPAARKVEARHVRAGGGGDRRGAAGPRRAAPALPGGRE